MSRALHVITYDFNAIEAETLLPKPSRKSGLVVHTDLLLRGIIEQYADLEVYLTHTGKASYCKSMYIDGRSIVGRGINTHHPQLLDNFGKKDNLRVRAFYEQMANKTSNPVWSKYSEGVAWACGAVKESEVSIILQNINPIVAFLKAIFSGLIDPKPIRSVCAVIHDTANSVQRLAYVSERLHGLDINLRLVAVSHAVREELVRFGFSPNDISVIYNGMKIRNVPNNARTIFLDVIGRNHIQEARYITIPARRVPHKGHIVALEALEDAQCPHDVSILATGANLEVSQFLDYSERIRNEVSKRGLLRRFHLLDPITDAECQAIISCSDAVLLPSTEPEGFGYGLAEAMSLGVPVISSDLGGPKDYIVDQVNGTLVPPGSPRAIAQAINQLFSCPRKRQLMIDAAFESISLFGYRQMSEKYSELLFRY